VGRSESRFVSSKRGRASESQDSKESDYLKRAKEDTSFHINDVDPDSDFAQSVLLLRNDIHDVRSLVGLVEREHVELESEYEYLTGMKSVDTTASDE
jgi:hypothetical protein